MECTIPNSLTKLTSRVIDKKLNSLKEILNQDNLNALVSKIDDHFTDFLTCANLEDTIFCLENYLNRRGIGGILTQIPDDMGHLKMNEQLNDVITLRGQKDSHRPVSGTQKLVLNGDLSEIFKKSENKILFT